MIWGPVYCLPPFGGPCGPRFHCGANESYAKTMFTWSNINCGLASIVSLIDQRNNGVPAGQAAIIFVGNVTNGVGRNAAAATMQLHGNPMGNLINAAAGYGNPYSNFIGTTALMSACSPAMFWGCVPYMRPFCSPGFGFWC